MKRFFYFCLLSSLLVVLYLQSVDTYNELGNSNGRQACSDIVLYGMNGNVQIVFSKEKWEGYFL